MLFKSNKPLAELLRPQSIDEFVGQEHLLSENGIIRKMLKQKSLSSMIFWGPPGCGKTTLALLIAKEVNYVFFKLSAIDSGLKEVRQVIDYAEKAGKCILFIDEIHRFNKAQQDALLGAVENGTIVLIGATTENPGFEVISALLSRCQLYTLKPLNDSHLTKLLERAVDYIEKNLKVQIIVQETENLFNYSNGDARKMLNIIELLLYAQNENIVVNNENVNSVIVKKTGLYDKTGEYHYDTISAFIKSIRGSDPNATIYYLARMLENGEDPLFIARRMIISAAEDVGLANPTALVIANSCFEAVHKVGMPEARIILSETAIYLATSPKSNSAYMAIEQAMDFVKNTGDYSIPLHLRNAPIKVLKDLKYGQNYKYPHDYPNNFINQEYLPEEISGKVFYKPQNNNKENEIKKYLSALWKNKYNYNQNQ